METKYLMKMIKADRYRHPKVETIYVHWRIWAFINTRAVTEYIRIKVTYCELSKLENTKHYMKYMKIP